MKPTRNVLSSQETLPHCGERLHVVTVTTQTPSASPVPPCIDKGEVIEWKDARARSKLEWALTRMLASKVLRQPGSEAAPPETEGRGELKKGDEDVTN